MIAKTVSRDGSYFASPGLESAHLDYEDASGRVVPHSLTRALAISTEVVKSRSVRIPFQLPVSSVRWRVVIRNINYRTNTVYRGKVTLHSVSVGEGVRSMNGRPSAIFVSPDEADSVQYTPARDVVVDDLGDGWASEWQGGKLSAGVDYLLSYGYTTEGQEVQRNIGSGWQALGTPERATRVQDGHVKYTRRQPFDVRIEYATSAPTDLVVGDSIATGSNAMFPIHEAPLAIANRTLNRATRNHAFGGAGLSEWGGPHWADPDSFKWRDVTDYGFADRVFLALGNNDVHAGASLETLQNRFSSLTQLVRDRISQSLVVCTVTPRAAWVGTAKEDVRNAFNDWLRTFPDGVGAIAETAYLVEDNSRSAPRRDYNVGDGIHFNSNGSAAMASAIITAR